MEVIISKLLGLHQRHVAGQGPAIAEPLVEEQPATG
jgi:hypothetical protein